MNAPTKKIKAPTVEQVLEEGDRARNIAQRINAVMAEVDYIQKEKKAEMKYSIVSHDAVTAKVRPILQAHGIVYYPRDFNAVQNGNRTELIFTVRFENVDDRSDYIDVATMGYGVDPQDKGPGKAISYGVKYALLKVLGLETGDDPDTVQDTRANYSPRAEVTPSSAHPITEVQWRTLQDFADAKVIDLQRFCKFFQIASLKELPSNRYNEALAMAEAKKAKVSA